MFVVISYDISTESATGRKRLRRIAKLCSDYGQRAQNSVFECLVDPAEWVALRNRLLEEINPEEDSLRFYFLGKSYQRRVEHHGTKPLYNLEDDPLVL